MKIEIVKSFLSSPYDCQFGVVVPGKETVWFGDECEASQYAETLKMKSIYDLFNVNTQQCEAVSVPMSTEEAIAANNVLRHNREPVRWVVAVPYNDAPDGGDSFENSDCE
jgi:hypothetical protein